MLTFFLCTPFLAFITILFLPAENTDQIRRISLHLTLAIFYFSLLLWLTFDRTITYFQRIKTYNWLSFFNIDIVIGIDGISLFFILLTTFLIPLCLLASWKSVNYRLKEYVLIFLGLETLLVVIFTVLDLFLFFIFFESILIPMYLLIGIWGSRSRKINAAYYFFLYTLLRSILMLFGILSIIANTHTTNLLILLKHSFTESQQIWLWLAFFGSFAIKIPIIPFHLWLPEAHAEAPTTGSIILARILLKLGTYRLLRFSFPLFPERTIYFTPVVYTIALISVFYSSCTTLRQIDLKRIIAYSSVAHMNFALLGLFSKNIQRIERRIFVMLSHGLVSSALFFSIGILYDRHHNRLLRYFSRLTTIMPVFSLFFFIFILGNMRLPRTSSFVRELLILIRTFTYNSIVTTFRAFSLFFRAAYSIWCFNRICFRNIKVQYISSFYDVTFREFIILITFCFSIFVLGLYPNPILDTLHASTLSLFV